MRFDTTRNGNRQEAQGAAHLQWWEGLGRDNVDNSHVGGLSY